MLFCFVFVFFYKKQLLSNFLRNCGFFLEISSNLRKTLTPPPNSQWYGWAGGREKLRSSPTVSNATEAYKSLRASWSSASTITRKKQRLWIKLNINNKTATTKATWRFGRTSRSSSGDWWRPNLPNLHNTETWISRKRVQIMQIEKSPCSDKRHCFCCCCCCCFFFYQALKELKHVLSSVDIFGPRPGSRIMHLSIETPTPTPGQGGDLTWHHYKS